MKLCDKLFSTVEILQKHHDFFSFTIIFNKLLRNLIQSQLEQKDRIKNSLSEY